MTIEVMKQALEALETCMYPQQKQIQAITSLRQTIKQAEKQEPKKWVEVKCPLCGEMAVAHTHPNLNKEKNT
jgi:formylmethanofuran dehydrogenase subunit E